MTAKINVISSDARRLAEKSVLLHMKSTNLLSNDKDMTSLTSVLIRMTVIFCVANFLGAVLKKAMRKNSLGPG